VLSEGAHVVYKATEFYFPELERTIVWDDPDLRINWGNGGRPLVSENDAKGVRFRHAECFD
jgi:dTDP-4-dehydrorhamnose 3,5-epimerase